MFFTTSSKTNRPKFYKREPLRPDVQGKGAKKSGGSCRIVDPPKSFFVVKFSFLYPTELYQKSEEASHSTIFWRNFVVVVLALVVS
jgi:hypothetical protein